MGHRVNFQHPPQIDLSLAKRLMNKFDSKDLINCKSSFCRIAPIQSAKQKDSLQSVTKVDKFNNKYNSNYSFMTGKHIKIHVLL